MSLPSPYYEEPGITLYHADARTILPQLASQNIDLVLTDPPYGINIVSRDGTMGGTSASIKKWKGQINPRYPQIPYDDRPIEVAPLLRISKHQIIWGGQYIAHQSPPSGGWLVWYKRIFPQSNNFADCEIAWTSLNKPSRVFQHLWMGMLRDSEIQDHWHPTQKPVVLMKWCLSYCPEAQLILDPYMGAGPVAVACKDLHRRFIGIELEERWLKLAVARLAQEVFDFL